ncbi:MAG: hypothetical protein QOF02_916 [Blastocatellia bacterium]|jgi:hypothetical protein|nr:hypothetical protein [Blastocatellia bacterium]
MRQSDARARGNETFHALALSDVHPAGETAKQPARWRAMLDALTNAVRHPLALLLISSAVIPAVVYMLNARRTLAEDRQKKAVEIVKQNADFEGQLYSLYADLSLFHQNNKQTLAASLPSDKTGDELEKLRRAEIGRRQVELAKTFGARYAEFSKNYSDQHLWVDSLYVQGIILKLFTAEDVRKLRELQPEQPVSGLSANLLKLRDDIESYKQNFIDSAGLIGTYSALLLKKDYDPLTQSISDSISGAKGITGQYNNLRRERSIIIDNLVHDFTP